MDGFPCLSLDNESEESINIENVVATYNAEMEREAEIEQQYPRIMEK